MGRGRQKAKHTKVARDLKYFSPDTNYGALEEELAGNPRLDEDLSKWPEYAAAATTPTTSSTRTSSTSDVDQSAA